MRRTARGAAPEQYRDAAEHLAYYLKHYPTEEKDKALVNARKAFELSKRHVSVLRVTVDREAAEVLVNGKSVGIAPLDTDLFVEPGDQIIEARSGEARSRQVMFTEAGKEYDISLRFPQAAPEVLIPGWAVNTENDLPRSANETANKRPVWPIYVGSGLALAGLGTAIAATISGSSNKDEIQDIRQRIGASGCLSGTAHANDCSKMEDLAAGHNRDLTLSRIGWVVFGVAGAATAAYAVWPLISGTSSRASVSVALAPDGAWITGHF